MKLQTFGAVLLGALLLGGALPAHAEETAPMTAIAVRTANDMTTTVTQTIAAESTASGWEQKDGKRYYRTDSGDYAQGELVIDGIPYLFGYSGAQKTDWQTVDGKRFYYDPQTGEPVFGWFDYFEHRYYISADDGKCTGEQDIDGKHYCLSEEGVLFRGEFYRNGELCCADGQTGEIAAGVRKAGDSHYLTDADGVLLTGWQELDGRKYYADETTHLVQLGLFEQDGNYYFGTEDGLLYGEQALDGDRVLFDETTGALQTGWFTLDGKRLYLEPSSLQCCKDGFFRIGGEIYYFTADSTTGKGLVTVSGALFFLDDDGKRLTGLQAVDGANYYFDPENGCAVTGARKLDGGTIRLGSDGKQIFGWQTLGNDRFYTDPLTGYVLPGEQTVDGELCWFDENGRYTPDYVPEKVDGRLYDQNDPFWGTIQFTSASNSTMKASACGIFSFCNAIYALNGSTPDAIEVANWARSINAYRPGAGGTYREILYNNIEQQYGEQFNFSLGGQLWGQITDNRLTSHLMHGGVAVIHVPNHFMAVVGYDPDSGLYHVLESSESNSRGLEGDSWVTADKLSDGNTKVDWFVLIDNR